VKCDLGVSCLSERTLGDNRDMTATLCGEESKEGKARTDSRGGKEIIGQSVDVSTDLGRHSRAPMATCVQISLHCLSSAVN